MKLNAILLSVAYLLALSPGQKCEALIRTAFSSIYEQSRQLLEMILYNKEMIDGSIGSCVVL